jgi:serine/threonine protein kinase
MSIFMVTFMLMLMLMLMLMFMLMLNKFHLARRVSITELLQKGGVRQPNKGVVLRMMLRFSSQVLLAQNNANSELAKEIYENTKALPSTTTTLKFKNAGIQLNGQLHTGTSTLLICFKSTTPHVLKILNDDESTRQASLPSFASDHVVKCEMFERHCLMPLFPTTLEHIKLLDSEEVAKLWLQMKDGLECMHKLGYAHMDVKPSNIFIDHTGAFVLGDLGSVARFGEQTSSTDAFIPKGAVKDLKKASKVTDWWMLAMTICDKGCEDFNVGIGASDPTSSAVLAALQTRFPNVHAEFLLLLEQ